MKVAILLATYNSSKFIVEQLDSLYKQTFLDWNIFVHDDGSTDNTIEILNQYKTKYGNIQIIAPEITHLGPMKNFMFLLDNTEADYYFFCDHDDIWLPNKIETSLNLIKEEELKNTNNPILFHSDCTLVEGNLNLISSSMWKYAKIYPEIMHDKKYVMTSCFITGCTLCINKHVKKIIPPIPENAIMHDWWIGINAVFNGAKIISFHKSTILYRLHGKNDSGINKIGFISYFKMFSKYFFESKYDKQVKPFLKEYKVKRYKFYKSILVLRRFLYNYK